MNEMTNQETDTALILENELKRRVREVVQQVAYEIVRKEMREAFVKQKETMLMEVSLTVGKHLLLIENEGRKPLWEATPEEFGLTRENLNTHMLDNMRTAVPTQQEIDNALRKQTPPV
jgi:predicted RNase H-like nuclease